MKKLIKASIIAIGSLLFGGEILLKGMREMLLDMVFIGGTLITVGLVLAYMYLTNNNGKNGKG